MARPNSEFEQEATELTEGRQWDVSMFKEREKKFSRAELWSFDCAGLVVLAAVAFQLFEDKTDKRSKITTTAMMKQTA